MNGPDRIERRLHEARQWWPDAGVDDQAALSPDRRRGLLVELRRRRLRRATGVTAVAGLVGVAALVLTIVPGSSPGGHVQADQAPSRSAARPPTGGGTCVAVEVGDRGSVCAGTLTVTTAASIPANAFSSSVPASTGPANAASSAPKAATRTGTGSDTGTSPVRVDVGSDLSVALPSRPGIRWTAVAAADAGSTPSPSSAGADLGRTLPRHQATGTTGSALRLVRHKRAPGGGTTTTFRAVRTGTVVLTASAFVQCPTSVGNTRTGTPACRPGTQLWRVVVTVGKS